MWSARSDCPEACATAKAGLNMFCDETKVGGKMELAGAELE